MKRLDIALHVVAAVATAVLYFTVPVAKDMAPVAALPIEPAHSLRVIPVPDGYVRDGTSYSGAAQDDVPFFMDRAWFYEGTIQEKA